MGQVMSEQFSPMHKCVHTGCLQTSLRIAKDRNLKVRIDSVQSLGIATGQQQTNL